MKALYDFIGREKLGDTVKVATVSGRYYAMDRDNRWDRVKLAYDAMAGGEGRVCSSGVDAMEQAYSLGENDEFVHPSVVHEAGVPVGSMKDGDCAVFFNFRTDRTRELTRALAIDKFDGFGREGRLKFAEFVCMTEYDATFNLPVAFPPQSLDNILGEVISKDGLAQLRIAETEKYAHVTFFFNGGNEKPFPGEERVLIPSPKEVATYDLKPEMSAPAVTDELLARIASGKYDVIVLNYANPDMVGHTGIMEAAVRACEVVDGCLSRIVPAILAAGGVALVTADHGNCEKMYDNATHAPHTAHTSNPVPFIVTRAGLRLEPHGILADIAPTMLDIMGLAKPEEMTGRSLIIKS
jgi:2,3-bisphosphoglycerate-independent phosphoglycerate mutase